MSWSTRQIDYLRARWGKDPTRSISDALGMTRNAVIGKAHRIGLPDLGNPVGGGSRAKHAPKERVPYARRDDSGKPKVTGIKAARLLVKSEAVKAAPALPAEPPQPAIPSRFAKLAVLPQAGAAPLLKLERGQCVWPVNKAGKGEEHRFCGQPAEPGRPYCTEHRQRAKGRRSEASMEAGRENARQQARLSQAQSLVGGPGIIHAQRRG
jgi:GcrA cell cycle regulator